MDRFGILLGKTAPKMEAPQELKVTLPVYPRVVPGVAGATGLAGTDHYDFSTLWHDPDDYFIRTIPADQNAIITSLRPEPVIQVIHPKDGDLIIVSVPGANASLLEQYREIFKAAVDRLSVQCEVVLTNMKEH